jgi:hypothetical protein
VGVPNRVLLHDDIGVFISVFGRGQVLFFLINKNDKLFALSLLYLKKRRVPSSPIRRAFSSIVSAYTRSFCILALCEMRNQTTVQHLPLILHPSNQSCTRLWIWRRELVQRRRAGRGGRARPCPPPPVLHGDGNDHMVGHDGDDF